MNTLFDVTGIKNRLLDGSENVKRCIENQIDYDDVFKRIENVRKMSYNYLKFSIEDEIAALSLPSIAENC